jgi:hypothetical protein
MTRLASGWPLGRRPGGIELNLSCSAHLRTKRALLPKPPQPQEMPRPAKRVAGLGAHFSYAIRLLEILDRRLLAITYYLAPARRGPALPTFSGHTMRAGGQPSGEPSNYPNPHTPSATPEQRLDSLILVCEDETKSPQGRAAKHRRPNQHLWNVRARGTGSDPKADRMLIYIEPPGSLPLSRDSPRHSSS